MSQEQVQDLMRGVREGRLSRRRFVARAAALGFSASAIGAFLAACGAATTATNAVPTAQAAATNLAPTVNAAATTASGAAPTVAAVATSVAPTVNAVASQVAPTVAAAATTVAGGSPAAGGGGGTIKIYSSFPANGASKDQISSITNSITMALEEVKFKAGDFTLVYGDSEKLDDGSPAKSGEWDGTVEAANANKVVADPDAMVYIATFNSGAAKVSIPITNKADLVQISPANTYPGLTKQIANVVEQNEPGVYYPSNTRTYCRVIPTDDLQGAVAANFVQSLGVKKAYVLDDTELYGHGIALVFTSTAKKLGIDTVGPEGIDKSATDYRSLAQKVKTSGADMVYFGGITGNNAGKIWKDLRAVLGNDFKMMGPDGIFEQGFLDAAGDAAEGTYFSFGGLPPQQLQGKGADWYKNYKAKYNIEPQAYAAYGYEAASVVIDALKRAGKKDRAAIRQALMATKDWDGVLGKWSFTDTGDTTLTAMSINQAKDGKFVFVKTVEAPK
ncbi:MAG TPA: branched-chain amino acid ABC transporter substrate-binding protein [Thermomicrobiales bacterium]|nr:branched-chain amino acid ABC transporter substrate-binding protein [Thermomicrobiales bacterium]